MVRSFLPLLSLLILDVSGSHLWDFDTKIELVDNLMKECSIPNAQARSIANVVEVLKKDSESE
jgi:hypothetical protein